AARLGLRHRALQLPALHVGDHPLGGRRRAAHRPRGPLPDAHQGRLGRGRRPDRGRRVGPGLRHGVELGPRRRPTRPVADSRAALDVELLGLVVELLAGAATRARAARALSTPPARGDVSGRGPGALPRLARARPLLLHRAGRDLLRAPLGSPLALLASLDVLVLAGPLRALLHTTGWHLEHLLSRSPSLPTPSEQGKRGRNRAANAQVSSRLRTLP